MSGTSLDGLDLCLASFNYQNSIWNYQILSATTISYDERWKIKLQNIENQTALELAQTHVDYGHLIAYQILNFLKSTNIRPDFIASHGHTIFHQPQQHLTLQIGDGSSIAAITGIPVICNFRNKDIALEGQGAPLVPIGDMLLFHQYSACLNIGGFSNISYRKKNECIAFDICASNIVLNHYSKKLGQEFDKDGILAREGKTDVTLLEELNRLDFYNIENPKSLGKEWVLSHIYPTIQKYKLNICDILNTYTEHISIQINHILNSIQGNNILITGGGCKNKYLMERLQNISNKKLIIPEENLIDYKEALIFAFLGLLRWTEQNNCLKSVTGCKHDHCSGCIYL